MAKITRRNVLRTGVALAIPGAVTLVAGCNQSVETETPDQPKTKKNSNPETQESKPVSPGEKMKVQYLEIVSKEVDALCLQYSTIYKVKFSDPDPSFGGARTAKLEGGGMIGIRGPLRETEMPVVRPYLLVEDIKAAVESAEKAGAKVAMPPMDIPNHGKFAIVINGGIDCGFWQN